MSASRDDPYDAFSFRIMLNGNYVAGVSLVTGMEANEAELDDSPSGGHVKYEPIVFEGLVTGDPEFLQWMHLSTSEAPGNFNSRDVRQLVVEQYVQDNLRATHTVYDCWVSEYQGVPEADANAGANLIVVETVRLEHQGVHVRSAG
jgi:phage tail-like protein